MPDYFVLLAPVPFVSSFEQVQRLTFYQSKTFKTKGIALYAFHFYWHFNIAVLAGLLSVTHMYSITF